MNEKIQKALKVVNFIADDLKYNRITTRAQREESCKKLKDAIAVIIKESD